MNRRTTLKLLVAAAVPAAAAGEPTSMFKSILEASMTEKKGVTLYFKGQSIPGVVLKVDNEHVEMRSREYSRIVVRLDSIDAAAMA